MKNKHPGSEGIYSCDICQYHTVSRSNLEQHLIDHRTGTIADATDNPPVKGDKTEVSSPTSSIGANSVVNSKSLHSVLSLATTSGTQVLYYDPVTQQLSAGAPSGMAHQENTIVMADDATKQLMASSSTSVAAVSKAGEPESGAPPEANYVVSTGQGEQEVLLTVQDDTQTTHAATILPEGSIIYTQDPGQDGHQAIAIPHGQHHVIGEDRQVISSGSESTGLQHILTAIQNMSEEATVTLEDNRGEQTDGMSLEVATEDVDESVSQEQYIIEIPVESKN